MIRDFDTYRKNRAYEAVVPSSDNITVEHYLQERGIEVLKVDEVEVGWTDGFWVKSRVGKIYNIAGSLPGRSPLTDYEVYLYYWDWTIKEGGLDPIDRHPSFRGYPTFGHMQFTKAVSEIERMDKLDGVFAVYDIDDVNITNLRDMQGMNNRKVVYIESKFLTDVNAFIGEVKRKIKKFHRTWYFKGGNIYVITSNSTGDCKVEKINAIYN